MTETMMPRRAHLIAGGFPPGSSAGHDHDYARLRLLELLADHDVPASVANDFADLEKLLPVELRAGERVQPGHDSKACGGTGAQPTSHRDSTAQRDIHGEDRPTDASEEPPGCLRKHGHETGALLFDSLRGAALGFLAARYLRLC